MSEEPRIWAGHAMAEGKCAIAYGRLSHEAPFTTILMYDEGSTDLWGYVDVPRTIYSLASTDKAADGSERYLALSDEGDIYLLAEDIPVVKIPGAGSLSEDSEDLGSTNAIRVGEHSVLVCGEASQVYRSVDGGRWERICDPEQIADRRVSFLSVSEISKDQVLACGSTGVVHRKPTQEELDHLDRLMEDGDMEAYVLKSLEYESVESYSRGCMYRYESGGWTELQSGTNHYLNDVCRLADGSAVVAGGGGTVVKVHKDGKVENVAVPDLEDALLQIRLGRSGVQVLSEAAILRFDSDMALVDQVRLPEFAMSPFSFDVVGNVTLLFDRNHVARYVDGSWHELEVPRALKARVQ